jgi:HEAT repeat protein
MRGKTVSIIAVALIMSGIVGCSRTVEDVAKWESKSNTEKLKEALTDPKFEVRQASAEALGRLQASDAVDALAACLNDSETEVQLAAIDALCAIGTRDTFTPLAAAFKLDDMNARLKAAEALGALEAVPAIEVLSGGLYDKDEMIQLAACEAIGAIGSKKGSQPLADKLAGESAALKVRMACIDALAHTGGEVALGALVKTLADDDERIRDKATTALIRIGKPAVPAVIAGLRDENALVRSASIKLLRGTGAIPTKGSGLVWYQLARASLDPDRELQTEVVTMLAAKGMDAVPALIEAASLSVPEIREPAAQSLEWIGEPAMNSLMTAAGQVVLFEVRQWFKGRESWVGAPSPLLDLYAAVSMLNPDFPEPMEAKALFTSDTAPERAWIPALVQHLNHAGDRERTTRLLESAGPTAALPLIAAVRSPETTIAEAAAALLSDRMDIRALGALMEAVQARVDAGEVLSQSPLYTALLKLDHPDAEPLILKVRPNTARALVVFGRQYRDAKVIGAETTDPFTDNEAPVNVRVAYLENNQPGTLEITFKKDPGGNWHPSPALPYALTKPPQAGQ